LAQALAKLEQTAAAAVMRVGDRTHCDRPDAAVRWSFEQPALLRLADDLSHVRLLI
jgi:hypothetical protein